MKLTELVNTKVIDEVLSLLSRQWAGRKYLEHFNARTVDEAISLLSDYRGEARIIAGGVDVISLMKSQVIIPKVLVNIKTIPNLAYIREDAQELKIGPLTTINEIKTAAKDRYTMLAEAAHSVGAPQVRNMATIGGNLCQEVRCWYYRRSPVTGNSFFCRRKGGEHCYAVAGENEYHAIFSVGECHAVCPSDLAPALMALKAKVKIAGLAGEKIIPLEHLYTPLGNALKPDEIITEVQIPTPAPGTRQRYLKFRLRKAIDFAISSVAAAITIESGVITEARIVLGGVAPIPYRAIRAEEVLTGKVLTESLAEAAAKAAVSQAIPLSKNDHKVPITKTLIKRAIIGSLTQ